LNYLQEEIDDSNHCGEIMGFGFKISELLVFWTLPQERLSDYEEPDDIYNDGKSEHHENWKFLHLGKLEFEMEVWGTLVEV
jgi:hypothetical protein